MKNTEISRKKFLSNSLKTGVLISLAPLSKELLAFDASDAERARNEPFVYAESIGLNSPIQKILLTAMLAPNSHNTQPWKVKIESDSSFLLYGDSERTLFAIDPINRQFYHSQGTFLELARLAADSLMFDADIKLFPSGVPSFNNLESKPVAKFSIKPKDKCVHDFLFLALSKRMMNRGYYSGDWITDNETETLKTLSFTSKTKLQFILGEEKISSFFPPLIEGFAAETNLRAANEVSRVWFRKTTEEIYSKRDGITLEGNGLSGLKLWLVKKFFLDLSEEGWHSESSRKASIDLFTSQVKTSKGLVFFVTEGKDTAKEWVETGMDFMRFTLAIANQKLAFHTMNQAIEDYKESLPIQAQLKQMLGLSKTAKIQLMGRIGRNSHEFASPRRELTNILI